jgi:hypothetical protein
MCVKTLRNFRVERCTALVDKDVAYPFKTPLLDNFGVSLIRVELHSCCFDEHQGVDNILSIASLNEPFPKILAHA